MTPIHSNASQTWQFRVLTESGWVGMVTETRSEARALVKRFKKHGQKTTKPAMAKDEG